MNLFIMEFLYFPLRPLPAKLNWVKNVPDSKLTLRLPD